MKTLKLVVIGIAFFLTSTLIAQVSVNVNVGSPPLWGPVGFSGARYYYLPDVESYYDVQTSMFIYNVGGAWIHRTYLPTQFNGYDLYGGYKVVMTDYQGNIPYTYFKAHKIKFAKGYHGKPQKTYGERPRKENHKTNGYYKDNSYKKDNKNNEYGNKNSGYGNDNKGHGKGGGKGNRK